MNFFKYKLKKQSEAKTPDLFVVNKRTPFWKPLLLMLPALAILGIFTIVPFIFTVRDGFSQYDNEILQTGGHFTWGNFKDVAQDSVFTDGIRNSLIYAFISVPLIFIIAAVISAAIASVIRKRMRGFVQTIFFLPYITSAVSISLAFAFLFDWDKGLLNKIIQAFGGRGVQWLNDTDGHKSMYAMLIFGVWRGLAFDILILTTAMLSVDKTRYKAAAIDGASARTQFFRITLPSINKTTWFLITMGIIGAIKVFPLALFNNNVGSVNAHHASTLLTYVYFQVQEGNVGKAGAASVYLLLISIAFTIVFKGGLNQTIKLFNRLGEKRVSTKITSFKHKK